MPLPRRQRPPVGGVKYGHGDRAGGRAIGPLLWEGGCRGIRCDARKHFPLAVVAWTVGLTFFGNRSWQGWPAAAQIITGTGAAVVLLVSIGCAQWFELRRHVRRAWRWIAGSAAAWALGLGVFMAVATPLWQPGQDLWLTAAVGMGAAVLMALGMAAVTGLVMVRLLPKP